jgi:hypothetical protein
MFATEASESKGSELHAATPVQIPEMLDVGANSAAGWSTGAASIASQQGTLYLSGIVAR